MNDTLPIPYSFLILRSIRDNFFDELQNASQGRKTSLAFIENPLPRRPLIDDDQTFQVMSIGGTIFETALVKKDDQKIKLFEYQKKELPILKTRDILCRLFEKNLHPEIETIGLNFAFPLRPISREVLDGLLIKGAKGHKLQGLVGKLVGEKIEKFIWQKKKRKIQITLANDIVCLSLAGLEQAPLPEVVGGIVGTGTNFGFFDKRSIINLESGNFDKFPQSSAGRVIDRKSIDPGKQLFEKEISGAYLFEHYNILAKELNLGCPPIFQTTALSKIASQDASQESRLAQKVLEHSASLIASEMAAIYQFKGLSKITFVMEGRLFWEGFRYQETVKNYLEKLNVPRPAVQFIKIKNSSLLGVAKLVLGNK